MTTPLDVGYFQAQVYPSPPCWNLVSAVYTQHLGETVEDYRTISQSVRSVASAFRLALHKTQHGFMQIDEPADYAVVLMGKSPRLGLHHCGIYYDGSVLHAQDNGTFYEDLFGLRADYPLMEFWSKSL